jgi:Na+/melibiose symporter-like transporter
MSRVEQNTPITNDNDPDKNKQGNTFRTVLSLFAVIAIIAGLFISQFAGPTFFIVGICLLGAGGIIFLYLTFCTNN